MIDIGKIEMVLQTARKMIRLVFVWGMGGLNLWLCCGVHTAYAIEDEKQLSVADEIRREATLPNFSEVGRPLPLAAHWNVGKLKGGFNPAYQMKLIDEGHYILPWFHMPEPGKPSDTIYYLPLKRAAELYLPISFVGTQWERLLYDNQHFYSLPADQNPNVVGQNGEILKRISPFGPIGLWADVGKLWAENPVLKLMQEWYPNPPLVIFVSNNEASKLNWTEYRKVSQHALRYQAGESELGIIREIGKGWIERYRALQDGMRHSWAFDRWKSNSIFIGYNAFGTSAFGRWPLWHHYSLHDGERIEPWPLAWDGASLSYYLYHWDKISDHTIWSPQIEAMNWVFMLEEAYRLNPNFWFEISTWDGYTTLPGKNKRAAFAELGQSYTPERYAGMVQFGMWLLRPRVVREYRDHTDTVMDTGPYFNAVMSAVDRVHNDPVLRKFWRKGTLVPNPSGRHPYQHNIPEKYKAVDRWFLLDTNLTPQRPWDLKTDIPVYCICLEIGESPSREWIVYVFSPLQSRKQVEITLPTYGHIKLDTPIEGAMYHVTEKDKKAKIIKDGKRLAPPKVKIGAKMDSHF